MGISNPVADNQIMGLVLVDTAANRPAAGTSGRWFIASDTLAISYDNGSAWVTVGTLGGLDLGSHVSRHENTGADEISVAGLSGLLADGQTPLAHKTSHENTGADEISVAGLSGELADRQKSKVGDSTLGWTADKLLKGAGSGLSPVEIDIPSAGATLAFPGTQVFSGTSPTSWTDLDLSAVVGATTALVVLRIDSSNASPTEVGFRTNGETAELHKGVDSSYANCISGMEEIEDSEFGLVLAITDSAGIVEWITGAAYATMTIKVLAYIAI